MSKGTRHDGPVVLIVLDGWGHRQEVEGNAIELGRTPTWHGLVGSLPGTLLNASGPAVGLPDGQMGNSEVGHLNLGAGRVVDQDIVRISAAMDRGTFATIPEVVALCDAVRARNGTLHVIGLVGTGGVHAVHRHLTGFLDAARSHRVPGLAVHGFLDGRDTPPKSAADFVRTVEDDLARARSKGLDAVLASVTGRYYAMDRDRRWPRTKLAYDALVHGRGRAVVDAEAGILNAYREGETDEFIKPLVITRDNEPIRPIRNGDGVFCLNFRADRMRQIVRALAFEDFAEFDTGERPSVEVVTMTQYDETFPMPNAFPPVTMSRFVAEVVSQAGKTMFRTAETEKYAHVTYFFNCGIEKPFDGEERELIPSQHVATYDLKPEMSAPGITDALCRAIDGRQHDFILCNYANGDMVGHTGILEAAVTAVETIDVSLRRVLKAADSAHAVLMITADHGNCELMIDPATGGPHTAHTTNKVPFLLVGDDGTRELRPNASLCDVGPTVLNLLGIDPPREMTGDDLRAGIT